MDQQGQSSTSKVEENMKRLEDLAKGLQGDAEKSLKDTHAILLSVRENMDIDTAMKMKSEMEAAGTSFEQMHQELSKMKKHAERSYQ